MRKILATLLIPIFLSFCQHHESQNDKNKKMIKQLVELYVINMIIFNTPQYEDSACVSYSQPLNPAYIFYWPALHANTTQYSHLIVGDSTMAISTIYAGYMGTGTGTVAIAGNTLCDMITQMPAINATSPSLIIVSTAGGNDLLRQNISNANIINTGTLLIKRLHQKFPSAKLVVIGVHPTLVSYANANKATTNNGIQAALTAEYGSQGCFVNPLVLFGVAEGAAANQTDMIQRADGSYDTVHYNQAMSFSIKNKVQTDCSVSY